MKLLSALLLVLLALPARAENWDARLTAFTGEVVVHPADGSEAVEAQVDMPLEPGDRVVTSSASTAEVSLDGESLIAVAESSDFTIEKADKNESVFALTVGSLIAKIQHLGDQRLSVRTPTSVAAVRGTEFGVEVESPEQSHVGVFDEGRVEVKGEGGTEVLTPNQETSVRRGMAPMKARALQRFAARREAMRGHLQRLQAVRRNWKAMSVERRRERRARALQRRARNRAVIRGRRRPRTQKPRRRAPAPSPRPKEPRVPRPRPNRKHERHD